MGKKGKGFAGTIIKDTWTITREGWKQGREVGRAGWWGGVGGKGRKLYLNSNKKCKKNIKLIHCREQAEAKKEKEML